MFFLRGWFETFANSKVLGIFVIAFSFLHNIKCHFVFFLLQFDKAHNYMYSIHIIAMVVRWHPQLSYYASSLEIFILPLLGVHRISGVHCTKHV